MRVFLSYASEQRDLAESVALRLGNIGVHVFFDRDDIVPSDSFDSDIRAALARCDVFLFFASPDSLRPGAYALTELKMAQQKWPLAMGHVLPVLLGDMALASLPSYLASVSVLRSEGDLVAEVVNAIEKLSSRIRKTRRRRIALVGLSLLGLTGPGIVLNRLWFTTPLKVTDVSVVRVENTKEEFMFESILRNSGKEAVTSMESFAEANVPDVDFGCSSQIVDVRPGAEERTSARCSFNKGSPTSRFKWRVCWTVVDADKWHEFDARLNELQRSRLPDTNGDAHPEVSDAGDDYVPAHDQSSAIENFVHQHGKKICSSFRPWSAPPETVTKLRVP